MAKAFPVDLPIDSLLPGIVRAVGDDGRLVLQAKPGAGKTTRVPPALLDLAGGEEVWVLEPRRIAARLAAARVAEEIGEKPGGTVGYRVRLEDVGGPDTRLRYVTEGIFMRRFARDPTLAGVSILVLDEFHERHLQSDFALAAACSLKQGVRPDLKIVIMSATLETDSIADHLGGAPVIRSQGRLHHVDIEHAPHQNERPLSERVAAAVRGAIKGRGAAEPASGDILVFLPGAAEIRRTREALATFAKEKNLDLFPLHGTLPAAEQDQAVRRGERRKVILATNVAETSITIPSVTTVIDSGLERVASHSPWSGLPSLEVRSISRSSATQRAGRAGRVAPGRCIRLYSQHDLHGRPEHISPEIVRTDLSELWLVSASAGVEDPAALPWLDRPPEAALEAARKLLRELGAITDKGVVTPTGKEMAKLPVHPRQGRLLVEASRRDVFGPACVLAAIAGERDILARGRDLTAREATTSGPCDLLERRDRLMEAGGSRLNPGICRRLGLDFGAAQTVVRAAEQLCKPRSARWDTSLTTEQEAELRLCVLSAWPDRVARRRRPGKPAFVLAEGGEVRPAPTSVVREADWLVAVDAMRSGKSVLVHLASSIESDWLIDVFPEKLKERLDVTWNAKKRRVDAHSRLTFGEAVLMESREPARDHPETWRLLSEQAKKAGLSAFANTDVMENLAGRLRIAAEADPKAGYPLLDEVALDDAVTRLCEGHGSFDELTTSGLVDSILAPLSWPARLRLDDLAPTHIELPGRRRAPVRYPAGGAPYVASRIQDFFGLRETPRIGGGRLPLVVHLLAPNNRAVQVTRDLAGFWERHYPDIRRGLSRRYPRHRWPETPD